MQALLSQLRKADPEPRLYVLLHHIDGPGSLTWPSSAVPCEQLNVSAFAGLRSREAQALLAGLAACPCVSLLASFEHVNTPLLWDAQRLAAFNWLYFDVTSYQPYGSETAGLPSLLSNVRCRHSDTAKWSAMACTQDSETQAGCRQADSNRSAGVVLRTLVPAAAKIFRILAEHQLADEDGAGGPEICLALDSGYPGLTAVCCTGMTFPHLYRKCREKFLVTNEVALRSHLTEFRDHRLVATRCTIFSAPPAVSSLTDILSAAQLRGERFAAAGHLRPACACRRNAEGADELLVPIDQEELQQLLEAMEAGAALPAAPQ